MMQTTFHALILVTCLVLPSSIPSTGLAGHGPTFPAKEPGGLEELADRLAGRLDIDYVLRKDDTVVVYAPWTEEHRLTSLGVMIETGLAGYLASVGRGKGYRVLPSSGVPNTKGRVVRLAGSLRTTAGPGDERWIEVDVTLYAEPDLQVLKRATGRITMTRSVMENLGTRTKPTRHWESFLFRITEPVTKDSVPSSRVEVLLNSSRYVKGEKATIRFRSSMDGFGYVFCLIEDGTVSMLVPNSDRKQVQVSAGEWVTYPGEKEKELGTEVIVGPFGDHEISRETIKVIVTDRPLDEFWKVPAADEKTLAGTDVEVVDLIEILDSLTSRDIHWTCGQKTYTVEDNKK